MILLLDAQEWRVGIPPHLQPEPDCRFKCLGEVWNLEVKKASAWRKAHEEV